MVKTAQKTTLGNVSMSRLPPALRAEDRAAQRLAWWTLAYLISVGLVLYAVAGLSQALRAAWLETVFSIITPVLFLVSTHISRRKPNRRYPYGYGRWTSIAFLGAAIALFGLGFYLIYDAVTMLFNMPRDLSIGSVPLFGGNLWLGWPIFAVLAWSAVPAWFIGQRQSRRAHRLHDKLLNTDASMRQADWVTAAAAGVGVIGIAIGWPEADPIAAGLIALSILRSGSSQLRHAISDLADSAPTDLDGRPEAISEEIAEWLCQQGWIAEARVRLREEGRLIFGDALVVPCDHHDLTRNLAAAADAIGAAHWRVQDLVLMPVASLPADQDADR